MIDHRIAICVVCSIAGHFLAGEALSTLPERAVATPKRRIEVHVVAPPEPPPEPPPPEPAPEPPPQVVERVEPRPRPRTPVAPTTETPPPDVPPVVTTTATPTSTAPPVFGVTMESTGGSGPAVPVGNTTSPAAPRAPAAPTSAAPRAPAPAHEVTKMPLPRGRCSGTYTDAARAAAIEGVVVLDLIVDEHGRARDIVVVGGLPHGLTEAALAALHACTFEPGERGGVAVPVRVRGFKIRFVLDAG